MNNVKNIHLIMNIDQIHTFIHNLVFVTIFNTKILIAPNTHVVFID